MPTSGYRQIGVNEAGRVTGSSTDEPFGNTQQEGVVLQLSTETADLMSGQAKVMEDVNLVEASMELQINLVEAALQAIQELYGLPAGNFSGDLTAGSPTEEQLDLDENIGTQEETIYALGPGPSSTRRIEGQRCRISDLGGLTMASDSYMLPQATWQVLNPTSGVPLFIRDNT